MRESSSSEKLRLEILVHSARAIEWRQVSVVGKAEWKPAPGERDIEVRGTLRPDRPLLLTRTLAAHFARHDLRRGLRQLKQELEAAMCRPWSGSLLAATGGEICEKA
jgi:hypothetical protein